jgi:hypothetical protein
MQHGERLFLGPKIDYLMDIERLNREGPTLKNVSDCFRSIAVCVTMLVLVSVLYKNLDNYRKIIAIVFWLWIFWYTILSSLQATFLFMMSVLVWLPKWSFNKKNEIRPVWVYVISWLSMLMMYAIFFTVLFGALAVKF